MEKWSFLRYFQMSMASLSITLVRLHTVHILARGGFPTPNPVSDGQSNAINLIKRLSKDVTVER